MMKRIHAVLLLSGVILIATPQQSHAFLGMNSFCKDMQAEAEAYNAETGTMLDEITRQDRMFVSCESKRIVATVMVDGTKADMNKDWEQTMQEQWNANFCAPGSPHLKAIKKGWTIVSQSVFKNGDIHRITATCK